MADNIVITGLGVVSPIGGEERRFWDSLCAGRSGASPVDCLDTSELTRKIACQVREPLDVAEPLGRAAQLTVTAARQAVTSAGLTPAEIEPGRTAIIIGTTMGETEFIEQRLDAPDADWLSEQHMQLIASAPPGSLARNVQRDLGVSGTAVDLFGACAAGNMALGTAVRSLRAGECDVVLAGGADGFSRLAFLGFMRLRIMAAETCRPFDQDRDGLLVGEGATVFVLEREAQARARGAPLRARVLGCATTCENYHPTRPDPEGDGLTRATQDALRDAGLQPQDIDYVCAHGTGTPQNDAIEIKVMRKCFPQGVSFSSIKALTGHTMGAASAMEAACCVLSLQEQTLIPTWHLDNPAETGPLEALRGAAQPKTVRHALNNSAGFGGYNSSVILAAD
ncbi:MAG: beta-ketoacyl-[acyl-carrier-protein] synthase family protein [Phycisphaerae bacterium]|nr:beta-ketoacyl-[acyl-carrier-protein] synthase family protein [Phycisphaerae bacterium]